MTATAHRRPAARVLADRPGSAPTTSPWSTPTRTWSPRASCWRRPTRWCTACARSGSSPATRSRCSCRTASRCSSSTSPSPRPASTSSRSTGTSSGPRSPTSSTTARRRRSSPTRGSPSSARAAADEIDFPADGPLRGRRRHRRASAPTTTSRRASPPTMPADRQAGMVMNYTSGTTGTPEGRAPQPARASTPRRGGGGFGGMLYMFGLQPFDDNVHIVGSPLYHTAVLVFAGSAIHIGPHRRPDGQVDAAADAAPHRPLPASPTRTWCRRSSCGCSALPDEVQRASTTCRRCAT